MHEPTFRVLYIHGLESSPHGGKVRALRAAHFEVIAPDLQVGVWQLGRARAVVRQVLRDPETLSAVGCAAAGAALGLCWRRWGLLGASIGGLAFWGGLRARSLFARGLWQSLTDNTETARRAVAEHPPDVVVGSSWGGAVALRLITEGTWRGPTALLAPALQEVLRRSRRRDAEAILRATQAALQALPAVIFHDPTDAVIPFADSEALAVSTGATLRAVDAGGHRLMGILDDGSLVATLRALAGATAPRS